MGKVIIWIVRYKMNRQKIGIISGNLGSVPNRWLGGSVVRWLGSCANPQPETHTSIPENDGLVPKALLYYPGEKAPLKLDGRTANLRGFSVYDMFVVE